jgi:hypothetical protein
MVNLNEIVVRKEKSSFNEVFKVTSLKEDKIDLELLSIFNTITNKNIFFDKSKVVLTNQNRYDFIPYF